MTVDKSRALQTLECRPFEPDGEQNVALAMWATFFVNDRHLFVWKPLVPSWSIALSACFRVGILRKWSRQRCSFSPVPNFLTHHRMSCQAQLGRIRNFLRQLMSEFWLNDGIRRH